MPLAHGARSELVVEASFVIWTARCQALQGDSSIQMTFDVYRRVLPSLEEDHAKFADGEAVLLGAVFG
jgi:hypothetical protein